MALSNIVTTPHCVCYINSVPFARCCGLTFDVSTPRKEIRGIDTLQAVEEIPVGFSVRGTLQVYRLHRDGGIESVGLIATFDSLTREKYASLMVIDRLTDTVLMQVDKMSVQNQSWSFVPKSFVIGTISFTGLNYNNDAETVR
jgi:hypothetical protein